MIIAIDIGNTNITIGGYKNNKLKFVSRIFTDSHLTEDQCFVSLNEALRLYSINPFEITGVVIGSVVPSITQYIERAIRRLCQTNPLIVNNNSFKGLPINFNSSIEFGVDLLCGATAAVILYGAPCIIIDLGTATTISVIDKNKKFIGGSILPGLKISLDALTTRTSLLSSISLEPPKQLINVDTAESMRSGLIYGSACMIDGMVQRINENLGYESKIILAGGFSSKIAPFCKSSVTLCENLVLHGLKAVYEINKT